MNQQKVLCAGSSFRLTAPRHCYNVIPFFLLAWIATTTCVRAFATLGTQTLFLRPNERSQATTFHRAAGQEAEFNYNTPQWQSHVSTHPVGVNAFDQIWENVSKDSSNFTHAYLFVGQAHAKDFETIVQHASSRLDRVVLVSVLGGGVIGENVELDQLERPSMSLLIGNLPGDAGVTLEEINNNNFDEKARKIANDPKLGEDFGSWLVFSDPYAPVDKLISKDGIGIGDRVVAGGISCPFSPNQPSLAIGDRCLPQGSAIAIGFKGSITLQCIVAQGSRPIGSIYEVTACKQNIITELDNRPAITVLETLANDASPEEKVLLQSSLMCGITSSGNENDDDSSIDFLTRQIMGFVPSQSGIAIGTNDVRKGDLFCFQVRDGKTAEQDMELMVQRAKTARLFDNARGARPLAALQISCVARGRDMFDGTPNVDLSNVRQLVEDKPIVGGFYANGEIGPIGLAGFSTTRASNGQSHLHGFTTVAVLLCEQARTSRNDDIALTSGLLDEDAWG